MERRAFLRFKSLLLALLLAAVPNALGQSAKQKREADYQAALQSCSEVLRAGMSREGVEDSQQSKVSGADALVQQLTDKFNDADKKGVLVIALRASEGEAWTFGAWMADQIETYLANPGKPWK